MPTTYASSSDGLFLQSVTEQKHQGGLFTVSAEYHRISGNTSLPSTIPSSEGDITVYPKPTITIGTDGFEKVNATGYAIWAGSAFRKFSLEVGELDVVYYGWKFVPGAPGEAGHWDPIIRESKVGGYIFETSHSTKMRMKSDDSLPLMPTLRILNYSGVEVLQYTDTAAFDLGPVPISVSKTVKNIQVTDFGEVEQVEIVHGISSAKVTLSRPDPNTLIVPDPNV
jgi:hypothetical protein